MSEQRPQEIVRRGYDRIPDSYERWSTDGSGIRPWFLREVVARIPPGGDILELGCGTAREAVELARAGRYSGIDISGAMLQFARERLPEGRFELGDYTRLERLAGSLDAVVSFYSFNHVPIEERWSLVERIHGWLRPRGIFCASLSGGGRFEEVENDWLRAPMYFAGQTRRDDLQMLEAAGFGVEMSEMRQEIEEGHGTARFHWVIGRKRG